MQYPKLKVYSCLIGMIILCVNACIILSGCAAKEFKPVPGMSLEAFAQLAYNSKGAYVWDGPEGSFIRYKFSPWDKTTNDSLVYYFKGNVLYPTAVAKAAISKEKQAAKLSQKIEAEENKKIRDSVDLVASILNYSTGCDDAGCLTGTWYPIDVKKCIYGYKVFNKNRKMRPYERPEEDRELYLNSLDPSSFKIDVLISPYSKSPQGYQIKLNDRVIFRPSATAVDKDRLYRGWSEIYSKHCTGIKRAF
jgi:hypothetical protein